MKKEHAILKIRNDRIYKYLNKITNGKRSALDKKLIEPAEVVEVDESDDDDELEVEPLDEAEVVVFSDDDELDDVVLSTDPTSALPRAFDGTFPKTTNANKFNRRRRCILIFLPMIICCRE